MRFRAILAGILALGIPAAKSDIRNCLCDLTNPQIATIKGCSLCLEAQKHPTNETVFLVRDANPTKPNRWLALPTAAHDGISPLSRMSAEERLALWTAAVTKAKEAWGDSWAIAMNGDISRTQCHAHVHIGKLLPNQEPADFQAPENFPDLKRAQGVYITSLSELPAIADGTGLWFHPEGSRFHLHVGEQTTETVLLR